MRIEFPSDTTIATSNLVARSFTRFGGKTSYPIVNRGTGSLQSAVWWVTRVMNYLEVMYQKMRANDFDVIYSRWKMKLDFVKVIRNITYTICIINIYVSTACLRDGMCKYVRPCAYICIVGCWIRMHRHTHARVFCVCMYLWVYAYESACVYAHVCICWYIYTLYICMYMHVLV